MTEDNSSFEGNKEPMWQASNKTYSSGSISTTTIGGSFTSNGGYNCGTCHVWVPYAGSYAHVCSGSFRWYPTTYWYSYPETKACSYCKAINHDTPEACSRVKSIKYHENGKIKSIKFHRDLD